MRGTSFAVAEIILWMLAAGIVGALIGWIVRGFLRDAPVQDEFVAMARTAEHENRRLLDELIAAQAEVEALAELGPAPRDDAVDEPAAAIADEDLQRRLDAAHARILMLENQLRDEEDAAGEVEPTETAAPSTVADPPEDVAETDEDPLQEIARRTRGDDEPADDDLQRIRGVGPRLEMMLKEAGITSFRQVARLTPDDIEVITQSLKAFRGRIERDNWMGSAAEHHLEAYGEPVD